MTVTILRFLIERSIAASWVLLTVFVIWLLIRRRASPHLTSALWLIPLIALLAPVERLLRSPFPGSAPAERVQAWVEKAVDVTTEPIPVEPRASAEAAPQAAADSIEASSSPASPSRLESWPTMLLLAWAAIAATLLALFLRRHWKTAQWVRRAEPILDPERLRVFRELEERLELRRPVRYMAGNALDSPATWGIWRPIVLLPEKLTSTLDDAQMQWLLLHELAHVRRGDLAWHLVQRLVQIAYFFHPGVWLMNVIADRERECACDDVALAASRDLPRRRCAEAFFQVLQEGNRQPAAAGLPLCDHHTFIRRRFMRILDSKRPVFSGARPGTLIALGVFGLLAFSLASTAPAAAPLIQTVEEAAAPVADDRVKTSIDRGIGWLLETQGEDGGWPLSSEANVKSAGEIDVVGSQALAILALLGQADVSGETAQAIERGVDWLIDHQDAKNGCYAKMPSLSGNYSHALATWAVAKQYAKQKSTKLEASLGRAIQYCLKAQNPYRGWRYDEHPSGDNDSKMTGFFLLALDTARGAGLEVPAQRFHSAMSVIHEFTNEANGRTGFTQKGGQAPRFMKKLEDFPPEFSEETTAVAIRARLAAEPKPDDAIIDKGIRILKDRPPVWSQAIGSIDFWYWWSGAAALDETGARWQTWRAALIEALVPHQSEDGSWPAVDAWSEPGCRVIATALNVMALQHALE
ncbi:MAG: M56 family metallopeptidase [Planctomycetota bacterium]